MGYLGSIELTKLDDVKFVKVGGAVGVFVPLEQNPCVQIGKNNRCYLNISVRDSKNNAYGNSHIIIANVASKELRDSLGDDLRSKQPIIGNLKPDQFQANSYTVNVTEEATIVDDGDLPM